jgi:hypothetical protein
MAARGVVEGWKRRSANWREGIYQLGDGHGTARKERHVPGARVSAWTVRVPDLDLDVPPRPKYAVSWQSRSSTFMLPMTVVGLPDGGGFAGWVTPIR